MDTDKTRDIIAAKTLLNRIQSSLQSGCFLYFLDIDHPKPDRMKLPKLLIILFTTLLLSACISNTQLASNQAKQIDQKIEKVFVLIDNPNDLRFFKHFQQDFLLELLGAKVPAQIFDKTLITMETDEEINETIDTYQPSHVIWVTPKASSAALVDFTDSGVANEVRTGGLYYIEITEHRSQQIIWKGLLNTDEYLSIRSAALKSARKIVRDLQERNLIAVGQTGD